MSVNVSDRLRPFIAYSLLMVLSGSAFAATRAVGHIDMPAANVPGLKPADRILILGLIDGETANNTSVATIRLSEKPSWENVSLEDHGTFLQFVLPNTIVPRPGEFIDGNSPDITKIAAFQISPKDAAIRLFVNTDAAKVKRASRAEVLGDRIVVSIDHAAVEKDKSSETLVLATKGDPGKSMAAMPQPSVTVASATTSVSAPAASAATTLTPTAQAQPVPTTAKAPSADEIIAKTEVQQGIPAPASLVKNDATTANASLEAPNGFDMQDKLRRVAMFSAVMLAGLVGAYLLKPLWRRRRRGADADPNLSMQELASFALSPKQKLSLMQIGSERILLAVSPDNVNLITVLGGARGPRSFSEALSQASLQEPSFIPRSTALPSDSVDTVELRPSPYKAARDEAAVPGQVRRPAAKDRRGEKAPAQPRVEDGPALSESKSRSPKSRINYAVGDDGVVARPTTEDTRLANKDSGASADSAIKDVTRLIREKLKNLPAI